MVRLRFSLLGSHRTVVVGSHGFHLWRVPTKTRHAGPLRLHGRGVPVTCRSEGWAKPPGASATRWCIGRQHSCNCCLSSSSSLPLEPVWQVYTQGVCALAAASRPRPADEAQQQVSSLTVIRYLFRCAPFPNATPAVWLPQGPTSPQHLGAAGTSTRALTVPCSSSLSELQTPRAPPSNTQVTALATPGGSRPRNGMPHRSGLHGRGVPVTCKCAGWARRLPRRRP